VDLSKIEVGHSIHAKDVVLPKGVTLVLHVEQENPAVVVARSPKVKAEPEATGAPEAPAAPAATKLKDKEVKE
jgi:large subunit ribosomal protein L25